MNKVEELLRRVRVLDEKFSDEEQADILDVWTELTALNKKMSLGKVDSIKEIERMFELSKKVAIASKKQSKQQNKAMFGN